MKRPLASLSLLLAGSLFPPALEAAPPAGENDYYRLISFPLPEDVVLEVGGLDFLDKEKTQLLACTRRGEIWRIENVCAEEPALAGKPTKVADKQGKTREVLPDPSRVLRFQQMLAGLHEPLDELRLAGVRSRDGQPLLHPEAYYTLNRLPK